MPVILASSSSFLVGPSTSTWLFAWVILILLIALGVVLTKRHRQGRSSAAKWERANTEARAMEDEAARTPSSEELHEDLKRF